MKPFKVVAWPKWSPSNAYTGALSSALANGEKVQVSNLDMHWKIIVRAIVRPVDILHVHWLERCFWAPSALQIARQVLYVWLSAKIMRLRGAKLVWTAHDPNPHQSPINAVLFKSWTGWLWRAYRKQMLSMIDGIVLMSESHRDAVLSQFPAGRNVETIILPHPHYRGQYPDTITPQEARAKLSLRLPSFNSASPIIAFIGTLRDYKNPIGLLEAFRDLPDDATLLMAGSTESSEHTAKYQDLAADDKRVILDCHFVPDDQLQNWLRAADLMVLPYQRVTNSGSAHLALSFDLPVLVPDEPIFQELERYVGDEWIRRYSGKLTAKDLQSALEWLKQPRDQSPDLSKISWEVIAHDLNVFFHKLTKTKLTPKALC